MLRLLGWLFFFLILAFVYRTFSHAADFDYRDKHGVRHWNHYAHARHIRHTHRVRHKKRAIYIRVVKDHVKFEPLPEPPSEPPSEPTLQWPLQGPMPWGNVSKCCRQFDWQAD
jgi:hypothetical protein